MSEPVSVEKSVASPREREVSKTPAKVVASAAPTPSSLGKKKRVTALKKTVKKARVVPAAAQADTATDSVLSSAESESSDSSCSDDYVEDSFESDDLPSDGDSGEELDAYTSDDEDVSGPHWDTDPDRTWPVWQIDNVRLNMDSDAYEVSVLWDWRPAENAKRYRTWEPMDRMSETHAEEIQLAIRFKASSFTQFYQFCKQDDYGKRIIAASDDYSCIFNGLNLAARLIRRPNLIPQDVVAKFLADELKEGRDLRKGCTWKTFAKLLPRLRKAKCDIVVNQLQQNKVQGGRRGARVLQDLPLDDGLYLVGAYNRDFFRTLCRASCGE